MELPVLMAGCSRVVVMELDVNPGRNDGVKHRDACSILNVDGGILLLVKLIC